MTKDGYRRFQKIECISGAPNHVGIYGCGCCRKIHTLSLFKTFCRRNARAKFKEETKKLIDER